MPVVITCYEIPRDAKPPAGSAPQRLLLRAAVVPPSPFGYLELSEVADGDAAATTARELAEGATPARSGTYEVFHANDRAAAPFAAEDGSPIMFINCLQCANEDEDAAFSVWREINAYMVTKPGYRWHKLHRRAHPDAAFGFVNVVEWESAAAWEAAHDQGFRALAARPDLPFTPIPTLCFPVDDTVPSVAG
jgi:heme-degrading monooxygenase HmoA